MSMVNNTVNQLQTNAKISLLQFRRKTYLFYKDLKGFKKSGAAIATIATIKEKLLLHVTTIKLKELQRLQQLQQ